MTKLDGQQLQGSRCDLGSLQVRFGFSACTGSVEK